MLETSVSVVNQLGLHARAAAKLVRAAAQFKSQITLIVPSRDLSAEAKSILSVLTLSASIGTIIIVKAEGEDEKQAVESLSELFKTGFGEL